MRCRSARTTPEDVDRRAKPAYAKVSVPGIRVALVLERCPEVNMKGEKGLV